jgi:LPS-assembly lipoprotein
MRRRTFIGLAAAAPAAALTGCGFEPLYGDRGVAGAGIDEELAQIKVSPLPERRGQMLYNALLDRLNPRGEPKSPRYSLSLSLSEVRTTFGARRDTADTRANLQLFATYRLFDADSGVLMSSETAEATASYNILRARYASLVAEQDARRRVTEMVADEIKTRLAVFLNRRRAAATRPRS